MVNEENPEYRISEEDRTNGYVTRALTATAGVLLAGYVTLLGGHYVTSVKNNGFEQTHGEIRGSLEEFAEDLADARWDLLLN